MKFSLLLVLLAAVRARALTGFAVQDPAHSIENLSELKPDPGAESYRAFISHFSAKQGHGAAALLDQLRALHPESALVATQANEFNFVTFCNSSENGATLKQVPGDHQLVTAAFEPPRRRTEGVGRLRTHAIFGAYDLAWSGTTYRIYQAEWQDGFQRMRQSHVVAESEEEANRLILAVSTFATSLNEVILVFDQSRWTPDHDLWESVQKASWDDVILEADLKKAVIHEYKSFFTSSEIYKSLGVPWKRGVIFLGPPGNGKTISLKAMMKTVGVPSLYVKSFHSYGGDELGIRMIFERARREAPCLLVLEDMDSLITDQNRSFFLNEVDGLEDNDGLLLLGTTNHFDRLDPALSNRPSRFDRKYTFPDPNKAERRQYAVYWRNKLSKNEKIDFPESLLDEVAEATPKFSFAYMKEAFVAALITLAVDESGHPPSFASALLKQIALLKEQLDNPDNAFFPGPREDVEGATVQNGRAVGPRSGSTFSREAGSCMVRPQIWRPTVEMDIEPTSLSVRPIRVA